MKKKATNRPDGALTETIAVPRTNARKFAEALRTLQGMGFADTERSLLLLEAHRGNVEAVVDALINDVQPRPGSVPTKTVKRPLPKQAPTAELLARYHAALDTAVKVATVHNLPALRGNVVVLCDVSGSMDQPCSVAAGLGAGSSVRSVLDVGCLLGLMISYASENCEFRLFGSSPETAPDSPCHVLVPVDTDDSLFAAFEACKAKRKEVDSGTQFPYDLLAKWEAEGTVVDYLVLLSDMLISPTRRKAPEGPAVANTVVWEWHSGAGFVAFDAAAAQQLEAAHAAGKPTLALGGRVVDFAAMTQENVQTKRKRPVRRREVPAAGAGAAAEEPCPFDLEAAVANYRAKVNPALKFVCIDLLGTGRAHVGAKLDPLSGGDNLLISGFSDSVLRFLATQGDQVAAISAVELPPYGSGEERRPGAGPGAMAVDQ